MTRIILIVFLLLSLGIYAQQTTRFLITSDTHIYSPTAQFNETILYEFVEAAISEQVDFIFISGDLVIRGFNDPAQQDSVLKDWRFVLDTLDQHGIKFFACRGNNDLSSKAAWDSLFKGKYAFPQNGPENEKNITYGIEYDNLLFIAFDQYTEAHKINQGWLDEIISHNTQKHIFVAAHEPAFKLFHSGMSIYPAARDSLWESLLNAGTKIYFCGHDHFYDHAIIDDGDGDLSNDVHQVIVGTGSYFHGDSEYNGDNGRWTPMRVFHEQANGYVLVEVTDSGMHVTWKHRTEPGVFVEGGDDYFFATTAINRESKPVSGFVLHQSYPNPFNPITNIEFSIPKSEFVTLKIYNILGEEVATLVSEKLSAGKYQYEWDAGDMASGLYFYKLQTNNFSQTCKMVLMR